MSSILVLGGYGGFGGRLSRRLAAAGHEVIVGGRSIDKATLFCADVARSRPLRIDRDGDIRPVLARTRPDILIDAAGPFQQLGSEVITACIAAGVAYLDLADARAFVTEIGAFDAAAKAAGVAVVSGASSVPALSGAVARHLAEGMERITAIEIAISASSKAAAGRSVAEAILGGVGQPLRLWRGGRWAVDHGWNGLRRERFALADGSGIGPRWVALTDVPDLALLPGRLVGHPAVRFRAGTEAAVGAISLWLAGRLVRSGMMASLSGWSSMLSKGQRMMAAVGGDRSAMSVRLFGWRGGRRVERRWTLIAANDDGPEIPTLAAALLAERIAARRIPPGARDAGELLSLADFEPSFKSLAIAHETVEVGLPDPLYRRVMKRDFDRLSPMLRALHSPLRDGGAAGQADVVRGTGTVARLIATMLGFPRPGQHALHVHFEERGAGERWTRDFAGQRFSSAMTAAGERLVERFGALRFHFRLDVDGDGGLAMVMTRWSCLGLPLPLRLAPRTTAREWEEAGQFHFDVAIDLPLVRRIIAYRGWLTPCGAGDVDEPLPCAPAAG